MTFWLGVAVAYVLIAVVGVAWGVAIAHRWPGDGRGPWDIPDEWTPAPDGGGKTVDADELERMFNR